MSDLYDKIKGDARFRKEVAEKAVLVSSFQTSFRPKSALLDRMDRNSKNPGLKKCLQVHDKARMHGRGVAQPGQRAWFTPKGHGMNQFPVIQ